MSRIEGVEATSGSYAFDTSPSAFVLEYNYGGENGVYVHSELSMKR